MLAVMEKERGPAGRDAATHTHISYVLNYYIVPATIKLNEYT